MKKKSCTAKIVEKWAAAAEERAAKKAAEAIVAKAERKAEEEINYLKAKYGRLYCLMIFNHYPTLVFDDPDKWDLRIAGLWVMYQGLIDPDNTFFATPPADPTPAQLLAMYNDLDNAEKAVRTKTGTTEDRDNAWSIAYNQGVKMIMAYGQGIIFKNTSLAGDVAKALGLKIKSYTQADKDDFRIVVHQNGDSELISKLKKERGITFQWQGTSDPGSTQGWHELDIPPTSRCKITVPNALFKKGEWYFRVRKVEPDGTAREWSNILSVFIKPNV